MSSCKDDSRKLKCAVIYRFEHPLGSVHVYYKVYGGVVVPLPAASLLRSVSQVSHNTNLTARGYKYIHFPLSLVVVIPVLILRAIQQRQHCPDILSSLKPDESKRRTVTAKGQSPSRENETPDVASVPLCPVLRCNGEWRVRNPG